VVLAGASTQIAAGGAVPSGILTPGTYCLLVSDIGNQTAAVTWTATVTHP
jgi:hypothetical protein